MHIPFFSQAYEIDIYRMWDKEERQKARDVLYARNREESRTKFSIHAFKFEPHRVGSAEPLEKIAESYKGRIDRKVKRLASRMDADIAVLDGKKLDWGGISVTAYLIKYIHR